MKYLLALILICFTIDANCQIDRPIKKGNIILGGSVGFTYSNSHNSFKSYDKNSGQYYYQNTDHKYITYGLGPLFGYFIIDGLAIGLSPSYSYSHDEYNNNKTITNYIGAEPFVKYYFKNGFFTGVVAGYVYSISKDQSLDFIRKNSYLTINPAIGYAIFINSKVSLEPSLEYAFNKMIDKDNFGMQTDSKENYFLFRIGFHLFL